MAFIQKVLIRVSIQGVKSLWGITLFFQDWAPGTLTGGKKTFVYAPPVSVSGAQSRKNNAIPHSDLTPWILTLL